MENKIKKYGKKRKLIYKSRIIIIMRLLLFLEKYIKNYNLDKWVMRWTEGEST